MQYEAKLRNVLPKLKLEPSKKINSDFCDPVIQRNSGKPGASNLEKLVDCNKFFFNISRKVGMDFFHNLLKLEKLYLKQVSLIYYKSR